MSRRALRATAVAAAGTLVLSGCGFSPYDLPLPGGADTGNHPFTVTADFHDVLDLVPQSGVRYNDLAVGKVTKIELDGWNAKVTLKVNGDVKLPDNAVATIRQTSLLGEKFVSLEPPPTGGTGRLGDGDHLPLAQTGRNPEIEEVFSAASLLLNGGGLERTNTIISELNATLDGNEPQIKELLGTTEQFLGQLDDNKAALLTSLEKVNRLAIATNEQKDAITGALDSLPEALDVVNDQRDDLVKLLQALNKLGDTATDVIKTSKADTVADLKALTPVLRNLATASDELAYDFKALLTFPFTDGMVGNSIVRASGTCENPVKKFAVAEKDKPWCTGDYANLSIGLTLGAKHLENLLGLNLTDIFPEPGDDTGATTQQAAPDDLASSQVDELAKALENVPGLGDVLSPKKKSESSTSTPDKPTGGCLLGILGNCRTAAASGTTDRDLTAILTDTVLSEGGSVR